VIGKLTDYPEISDACKQYVIKACELGLVTGSNNRFNPKSSLTRAEASTVIIRFLDIQERKPMKPWAGEIIQLMDNNGNLVEVYPGSVWEYFDFAKSLFNAIPASKGYVCCGLNIHGNVFATFYKDKKTALDNPLDMIGGWDFSPDNPQYSDCDCYQLTVYNDHLYKELFADYSHEIIKALFLEDSSKALALHDKYMNMINNTGNRIWEETRLNNRKVGAHRDTAGFVFGASISGKK